MPPKRTSSTSRPPSSSTSKPKTSTAAASTAGYLKATRSSGKKQRLSIGEVKRTLSDDENSRQNSARSDKPPLPRGGGGGSTAEPIAGIKKVTDDHIDFSSDDDHDGIHSSSKKTSTDGYSQFSPNRRHTLGSTIPARGQRSPGAISFTDSDRLASTVGGDSGGGGALERRRSQGHVVNVVRSLTRSDSIHTRHPREPDQTLKPGNDSFRRTRSDGAAITTTSGYDGTSSKRQPATSTASRFAKTNAFCGSLSSSLETTPVATPTEASLAGSCSTRDGNPVANKQHRRRSTAVDIRTDIRNQRMADELAALEQKRIARTQHNPHVVLQKRWLEAIAVMLATRRFVVEGLGVVGNRQREAVARSTLLMQFVPLWRRYRAKRMAHAELVIQNFIMKAVMKKRRKERHQATDMIRAFLKTKMTYLRCVIKWYVEKVHKAQRMFRLMMVRRDAQVELNYRHVKAIEKSNYWQAVGQRSVSAAIKQQQQKLTYDSPLRSGRGRLVIPEYILRREVRKKITIRSRDYHREVIKRKESLKSLSRSQSGLTTPASGSTNPTTSHRSNPYHHPTNNFRKGSLTNLRMETRLEGSRRLTQPGIGTNGLLTSGSQSRSRQGSQDSASNESLATSTNYLSGGGGVNNRVRSPNPTAPPPLPTFSNSGTPTAEGLSNTSAFNIPLESESTTPTTTQPPATFTSWRVQHAAKMPHYQAFLTLEECFEVLDDACLATGGLRGEPEWTEHLEEGRRTKVPSSFRYARESFRKERQTEALLVAQSGGLARRLSIEISPPQPSVGSGGGGMASQPAALSDNHFPQDTFGRMVIG